MHYLIGLDTLNTNKWTRGTINTEYYSSCGKRVWVGLERRYPILSPGQLLQSEAQDAVYIGRPQRRNSSARSCTTRFLLKVNIVWFVSLVCSPLAATRLDSNRRICSSLCRLWVNSRMKYILHASPLVNVTVCITFLWNGIYHLVLRDLHEHH